MIQAARRPWARNLRPPPRRAAVLAFARTSTCARATMPARPASPSNVAFQPLAHRPTGAW
jgi:hypothetical protein